MSFTLGVTAVMLPELPFERQIDLCLKLGIHYYQYRPRDISEGQREKPWSNWGNHCFDLTPQRFADEGAALTRQLREAGLEPWGAVPNLTIEHDDDAIQLLIEGIVAADARCMRCGPPAYPKEPFDFENYLKRTRDRYMEVIEKYSGPAGVKLIVEMHADSSATSPGLARLLVDGFDPDQLGLILDLPNAAREGYVQPSLCISAVEPWLDCVHVGGARRVIGAVDEFGGHRIETPFCSLEESDIHTPSWLQILDVAGRTDLPLIIEDYTANMSGEDRLVRSARYLQRVIGSL